MSTTVYIIMEVQSNLIRGYKRDYDDALAWAKANGPVWTYSIIAVDELPS